MNRNDLIGGVVPALLSPDVAAYILGCSLSKFNKHHQPHLRPVASGGSRMYIKKEVEQYAENLARCQVSTLSEQPITVTTLTRQDSEFVDRLIRKTARQQSAALR